MAGVTRVFWPTAPPLPYTAIPDAALVTLLVPTSHRNVPMNVSQMTVWITRGGQDESMEWARVSTPFVGLALAREGGNGLAMLAFARFAQPAGLAQFSPGVGCFCHTRHGAVPRTP